MKMFLDLLLLLGLVATGLFAWAVAGLHAPDGLVLPLRAAMLLSLALVLWLRVGGQPLAWLTLAGVAGAHLAWFFSLQPSADRNWAPDLARTTTGQVQGDIATLTDLRAFDWESDGASARTWRADNYDLSRIARVDLITSTWGNEDIAHVIVSFQFEDGRDLAWSIEARRQVGETFNAVGGFLRQFDLAIVAGPEADLIDLRVNHRGEVVRRFPTTLTPDQGRRLFQAYVDYTNDLAARPRFYNIAIGNCTTIAWSIAGALRADLPLHPGLLLSGRLPDYLDTLDLLPGDTEMAARRDAALIAPRTR